MDDILARLHVTENQIAAFCEKWKIIQFELFGSVLRDDFDAESDVDVLVVFAPDAKISLFGLVTAEEELKALVGRPVDMVERGAIEESPNWIRRRSILNSTRLIYAAA
jgi:predicted nucleotidyltransferase